MNGRKIQKSVNNFALRGIIFKVKKKWKAGKIMEPVLTLKEKRKAIIVWVVTVVLATAIVYFGNFYAGAGLSLFVNDDLVSEAVVLSISSEEVEKYNISGAELENVTVHFECEILDGPYVGRTVTATQSIDRLYGEKGIKRVDEGDNIFLLYGQAVDGSADWYFLEYKRIDKIIVLCLLFFALILIFGKLKGINTILSLGYTCAYVFLVFVPAVLNGYDIYLHATLTCLYSIAVTLVLLNGWSTKSLTTAVGCVLGVLAAGAITIVMDKALMLSGFTDEHAIHLVMLNARNPIDLRAITFATIMIGALGAVMDVAMDLSSALYEIQVNAPNISFKRMVKSGFAIGRDTMGTMANTLVLAYIGSSLCSVLLLFTYTSSFADMMNKEGIIVEILQAIAGSTAILLTMPATVFTCAFFYVTRNHRKKQEKEQALE